MFQWLREVLPGGVRVRFLTFHEVSRHILAAWEARRPFSLIRVGDGENSILWWPRYVTPERIQYVFRRAFEDRRWQDGEIAGVRTGLIAAMREADIVAIHPVEEAEPVCAMAEPHLRYAGIRRLTACVPRIHFALQGTGQLADLIERAERVTLITGRDVMDRFRQRFPNARADQIAVRPENEYRITGEAERHAEHFPGRFRQILGEIAPASPHHLYLVGAGFLGKIYCAEVRRRGGFALDIGSVFDYWAKIPTREERLTVKNGKLIQRKSDRWPGVYLEDEPVPEAFLAKFPELTRPLRLRRTLLTERV